MRFVFRNDHCKMEKEVERIKGIQGDQLRGCCSLGNLYWLTLVEIGKNRWI